MNKISNALLLAALFCGTLATFFAGAAYENRSQQTLVIAQQLDHSVALATESYVMLSPPQRISNDHYVDQLIIMAANQRLKWWVKPCSLKTLNLSLLKAFQYRGLEPALAHLQGEIKKPNLDTLAKVKHETSVESVEIAYAFLTQDPAYDPLIRDLICNQAGLVRSNAASTPKASYLPPLPEDLKVPSD
ncbi:MAG: Uncharacterised protein [Opitutia bacterium UBA7350]|nr:MAG: Uncharacterised protein [Opitutae bacterium UBA7350]